MQPPQIALPHIDACDGESNTSDQYQSAGALLTWSQRCEERTQGRRHQRQSTREEWHAARRRPANTQPGQPRTYREPASDEVTDLRAAVRLRALRRGDGYRTRATSSDRVEQATTRAGASQNRGSGSATTRTFGGTADHLIGSGASGRAAPGKKHGAPRTRAKKQKL
jgi:hypothetical protein